jgi:hypothetical protein
MWYNHFVKPKEKMRNNWDLLKQAMKKLLLLVAYELYAQKRLLTRTQRIEPPSKYFLAKQQLCLNANSRMCQKLQVFHL